MDDISILKMEKNKNFKILGLLLFIIILSIKVNAMGVSSPYWDENPLYVQPGEVKEFSYLLQNMVGSEDIQMKAELEGTTDIMQFIDENTLYDVPLGSSDVPVRMIITIPQNAQEEDEWSVSVKFTTIIPSTEGVPVGIGTAFSKGFRVIVGAPISEAPETITSETTKKPLISNQLLGFLILIIILIILLLVISHIHKKKSK